LAQMVNSRDTTTTALPRAASAPVTKAPANRVGQVDRARCR
jgi:hypothetical protein